MDPLYRPEGVEERWQRTWEEEGLYGAEADDPRPTFVVAQLYRKGWIYRANRIVNWCPHHETTLSDLELIHAEVDDALTYVLYPYADGDGGVTIATARVPTILADVAVAVNPADARWKEAIGREVIVPFVE